MRSVRRKDDKLQILSKELVTFLVAMRLGVTPVPIPNTMVKTQAADGTALETMWESRWLPEFEKRKTGFTSDQRIEGIQFSDD
mgnify:CR=1 FL=1